MTGFEYAVQIIGVVLDTVVMFLTYFALKAAITANKQNKDEIREARDAAKQSLRMHEQSKSLQLMDLRIQLLDQIERYNAPQISSAIEPRKYDGTTPGISINKLKLLYNHDTNIIKTFKNLEEYYHKADSLINDILHFFSVNCQPDGYGGYCCPVWEEIMRYEDLRGQPDYSDSTENEFKAYCLNNTHPETNPVTGQIEEYNYYDMRKSLDCALQSFESTKESLITQMRVLIDESIKPIQR